MVSSLQAVGVLLSLGLLVLPAATIYLLSDSYSAMAWGGGALGALSAAAGLQDFLLGEHSVPGPAIILVLGLLFMTAYLFGPKYGIATKRFRKHHMHEESLKRWK